MDVLAIVKAVLQYGPTVAGIFNEAVSNDDVLTKLEKSVPSLAPIVTQIGSTLFPKATPALQAVAGVLAGFDPNTMKWVQNAVNSYLGPALSPPLTVDGIYGPKTQAAVQQVQAKLGLKVDGIPGKLTQAALDAILQKLPNFTPAPAAA